MNKKIFFNLSLGYQTLFELGAIVFRCACIFFLVLTCRYVKLVRRRDFLYLFEEEEEEEDGKELSSLASRIPNSEGS